MSSSWSLVASCRQVGFGPVVRGVGLRRQGQRQDRHVVDAAAHDQRRRDAHRDAVAVGADLVVDPQHRLVLVGADLEAGGHHHLIVLGRAVDVLDPGDRLEDGFQRLGDELGRVGGLEAVGLHHHVDHRHVDLRILVARDGQYRNEAGGQDREQEQRRERGADERPRQPAGDAELHGRTRIWPGVRPARICSPSGIAGVGRGSPRCTGASTVVPSAWRTRT